MGLNQMVKLLSFRVVSIDEFASDDMDENRPIATEGKGFRPKPLKN